jgi:hypothetical protein
VVVTIIVQSDELGDVRVSLNEDDAKDPEKQLAGILDHLASRVRKSYDIEPAF